MFIIESAVPEQEAIGRHFAGQVFLRQRRPLYGNSGSPQINTKRPPNPSRRRVSIACAPAWPPPMMRMVEIIGFLGSGYGVFSHAFIAGRGLPRKGDRTPTPPPGRRNRIWPCLLRTFVIVLSRRPNVDRSL